MRFLRFALALGIALAVVTCSGPPTQSDNTLADSPSDTFYDTIFIQDITGRKWDITHAVGVYGMDSARFSSGLGMNAFKPVDSPVFVQAGDPEFPRSGIALAVIGVNIEDDIRAYSPNDLIGKEVVNDQFGDVHVAIAY